MLPTPKSPSPPQVFKLGPAKVFKVSIPTCCQKFPSALLLLFKFLEIVSNIKLTQYQSMDNNQPATEFRYKAVIFYTFLSGILGAVLGVEFFQDIYFVFAVFALAYCLIKYVQMVFIMGYVNFKYSEAMNSYRKRRDNNYSSLKQITHTFVLPNYNEDIDLLRQTIQNLAAHSRSKNYCVFLAMEKHEIDVEEKAKKMVKQFDSKFRVMSYTIHEIVPGESKTKSSNINYCVRNMTPKLLENYVNMDTVIVTIMDSDSIIPEAYVDQMERHIEQNYDHKHTYIYQPPQMFTRNEREVAFFVRIVDNLMAFMHCSNLYSMFSFTLGVSNYSMSYRLLERIGFWDTCNFSKGEDMRTPAKAVWKTNGEAKTYPIYIPINQLSLVTSKGCWADFKARLLQAKRHSQDQTEVSYNFVNMTKSKMNLIKRFHTFFSVCEVYMMLIVIPIPILVLVLQDIIPVLPRSSLDSGNAFSIFNNINTIIILTGFALFQIFKKKASNQLYGIKTLNIFYAIQTPLLQIPMGILFGFGPMVLASINLLTDKITFTVTPKGKSLNFPKDQENMSMFQSEQIEENQLIEDIKKTGITSEVEQK